MKTSLVKLEASDVLNGHHGSESSSMIKEKLKKGRIFSVIGAASLPVLIPVLHLRVIGWFLWSQYDLQVDKSSCKCSCWDTAFKGQYERSVASYKHVYFNLTSNTLVIWVMTVACLLALYESGKKLVTLAFTSRIRLPMLVLFVSSVFPHYYSWWNYFNYLNDEFYSQWYHQLYFTLTELASTVCVYKLLDLDVAVSPRKLLVILSVATLHISGSLYDQFLSNVLTGKGKDFQVYRDLGLMFPDILHFWLAWIQLRKLKKPLNYLYSAKEGLMALLFLIFSWVIILAL